MNNILPFSAALIRKWWALMSCAVFTFLGLYSLVANKSNRWLIGASFVAAAFLFLVAAFLAWNDEHKGKIAAELQLKDEEPKVMFGLLSPVDWTNLDSFGEYVFTVTNYGKRPARYLQIQPVDSAAGVFRLNFEETDILLAGGQYHCIQHWVSEGTVTGTPLDKRKLWEFFHNCDLRLKAVQFDVLISFTDMQEKKQVRAIMRFDLATKKLGIDPH